MRIVYPYHYTEDVIPPRCRKLRPMSFPAEFRCSIPEVPSSDAPVGIIRKGCSVYPELQWRWWRRQLWLDRDGFRDHDGPYPPFAPGEWPFLPYCGRWGPQAEVVPRLRDYFRRFVLIDGQTYRRAFEPVYVVMTFGLGHNHGGTALMVEVNGYNSNIRWDSYFPLSRREAAIVEATRRAEARGDTDDLPIRPHCDFEVLIPEAVRANPKRHYGGAGDSFINRVESVIDHSESVAEAGALALLVLGTELRSEVGVGALAQLARQHRT